ncbi:hypothetical protein A4R35_22950 [Thermogemmatispora tikiterensis]|uniref:Uncharacterized protein n=2 Tax=Thermogemmatispora tikiterensis TaxID=1825093 RepID=A0A328VKI0_9CHLR|nr:hypothetical protein A4R35_22950 [Thermogemmatispora tikiterensis]
MSTLHQREHHLAAVNYGPLFEAIGQQLKRLQQENRLVGTILRVEEQRLSLNLDEIALAVAREAHRLANPVENVHGTRYASVHFADDKGRSQFSRDLEQHILHPLQQALSEVCRLRGQTPEQLVSSFFQPLQAFAAQSKQKGNYLCYPLSKSAIVRRRQLHFQRQPGTTDQTRLKGHKLTIDVQGIGELRKELIEGIKAHLKTYQETGQADAEELKEAETQLEQPTSQAAERINILCGTITDEGLARIQRTARLHYLTYIRQSLISDSRASDQERRAERLLQTLSERLRQLEAYIQRYPDSHYIVSYGQSERLNLRDLFSRADAFDPLPIFGEVAGQLGEIINEQQGVKRFIHGLRLKLNGKVHVHGGKGEESFKFHLALLQPDKPSFDERRQEAESNGTLEAFYTRIVRVAVLYFFAFKHWEDPSYQPEADFEQELLPVLRAGTQEEKEAALRRLAEELEPEQSTGAQKTSKKTSELLQDVRTALVASLKKPAHQSRPYRADLVISLSAGILSKDPEQLFIQHHFFSDDLSFQEDHRRELLKYISIEEASISSNVLCKLAVSLQIEPLYFLSKEHGSEETIGSYAMSYELGHLQALPVILLPIEADKQKQAECKKLFQQCFGGFKHIALGYGYHHQGLAVRSEAAFVYRFTYLLLAYLFIKLVVDSATAIEPARRFIPLICIHIKKEEAGQEHYDDESVLHGITKVLEHLLGADYPTSSQGMHLETLKEEGKNVYLLRSALCSLYSNLPHRFKPQSEQTNSGRAAARQAARQPARVTSAHRSAALQPAPAAATDADQSQPARLDKVAILVVSSRKCDYTTQARDHYLAVIYGEVLGLERQGNELLLRRLRTFADNHPSESMHTRPDIIIEQARYCAQQGYRHLLYVAHAPYSRTLGLTKGGARELFFMSQDVIQAMREVASDFRVYPIFCDLYYVLDLKASSARHDQESLYIDELRELADVVNDPSKRTVMFLNLYNGYYIPSGSPEAQERVYNGIMAYSTVTHVYDQDPSYEQYIWSDLLAPDQPGTIKHGLIEAITLLHFMRFERPSSPMMKLDPYKRTIGDRSTGAQAIIPHMKGQQRFNMLACLTHVRSVLRTLELKQGGGNHQHPEPPSSTAS